MMKSIQALRNGSKVQRAILLLFLSLCAAVVSPVLAQKRPEASPSVQNPSRQIAGTRGVARRTSIVNVAALSRQEAIAPPKFGDAGEASEEVEPPEEIPQNMPVPAGAAVSVEKRVAQSVTSTSASSIGASPAASASFLASDDTGRIPPDTHGAVGPNHLIVVHNGRVRIQDRTGNVVSTVSLVGFWSSLSNAPTDIFDPKILYDPYGARWMMTASANRTSANSSVMIGVSQTSDPTGNWNLYRIDADSSDVLWADYPSLGFNKNWIVVNVNMFPIVSGTGSFATNFYVFNKANLYAGGSGQYTLIKAPNLGGTIVPATTYDATLSALYLLQTWNGNSSGSGYLGLSSITGAIGSEVLNLANTTTPAFIGTPNPWDAGAPTISGTDDFAPQLSTTLKIQNNDSRMQNVVYRNGSLWCVHTIFLPAGGNATRTAIQWWQINPANNSIQQRGRIDDATGNTFYAFPTIAVNKDNDVLIGYSRYSTTQYASANYSFRAGTDALNLLRDDTVLKAGEASYFKTFNATPPRNRWGDYSNTVVDPVNDKDMWTIQEYAAPSVNGTDKWGTWWGRVSLTATAQPPVLQLSAPSFTVNEGAGSAVIQVNRTGDTTIPVSVNYATSDTAGLNPCSLVNGIASSRCDYATTIGTLQFAAGETSKNISIPIVDDAIVEGNETFNITLSVAVGGTIGTLFTAPITIIDNDTTRATSNPIDGVPFFVRQHYIDFLGREPDPAGFAGWQNTLNNCPASGIDANGNHCDRIEVSSDFFRSEEFQSRGYFIYRFYSAVGRIPHYAEFMPDFARVSGFLSAQQLEDNKVAFIADFMTRTDFQTKYGSLTDPTAYVTALLQTVGLPNHPSKQTWINSLTNGSMTKAKVLRALVESAEMYQKYYNEGFVIMQYFGYLRRDADISYLQWIQTMNSTGGDYRTMINGFLNSLEYRQRFGP
jgi:hypothetical protein